MKFCSIEQTLFNEYIGEYQTYGIISKNDKSIVEDVSVDKNEVENIVDLLNKYDVSIVHVRDVIEDYIEINM